jgi:hypothetical protein
LNFTNSSTTSQTRDSSSNGFYENGGIEKEEDLNEELEEEELDNEMDDSTNSSILNLIKAKLFGTTTATPDSSSHTSACFQNSSWNASTTHDSDEESHVSNFSRDSGNVVQKAGSECQITKRHPSNAKHKSKRRFVNTFVQQKQESPSSLDTSNVYAKDPNTPQPLSEQKEKVQDKDLYVR